MSLKDTYINAWEALPSTIASGQSITSANNLGGLRLCGILMPSAWTAANLTFQASFDGGTTWNNVKDASGAEIVVKAAADDCVVLLPAAFAAIPFLKVRSGLYGTPITQEENRVINLILRGV